MAPAIAIAAVVVLLVLGSAAVVYGVLFLRRSPYDGAWSGTGYLATDVTFKVRHGELVSLTIVTPEGTEEIEFGLVRPDITETKGFMHTDGDMVVVGTFLSETEAEGVYTKTGMTMPWTARKQ
jgi:hypothetical protein